MYLFIKNYENFIIRNNQVYQVRQIQIICEDCPNCMYVERYGSGEKQKVSKCENH